MNTIDMPWDEQETLVALEARYEKLDQIYQQLQGGAGFSLSMALEADQAMHELKVLDLHYGYESADKKRNVAMEEVSKGMWAVLAAAAAAVLAVIYKIVKWLTGSGGSSGGGGGGGGSSSGPARSEQAADKIKKSAVVIKDVQQIIKEPAVQGSNITLANATDKHHAQDILDPKEREAYEAFCERVEEDIRAHFNSSWNQHAKMISFARNMDEVIHIFASGNWQRELDALQGMAEQYAAKFIVPLQNYLDQHFADLEKLKTGKVMTAQHIQEMNAITKGNDEALKLFDDKVANLLRVGDLIDKGHLFANYKEEPIKGRGMERIGEIVDGYMSAKGPDEVIKLLEGHEVFAKTCETFAQQMEEAHKGYETEQNQMKEQLDGNYDGSFIRRNYLQPVCGKYMKKMRNLAKVIGHGARVMKYAQDYGGYLAVSMGEVADDFKKLHKLIEQYAAATHKDMNAAFEKQWEELEARAKELKPHAHAWVYGDKK